MLAGEKDEGLLYERRDLRLERRENGFLYLLGSKDCDACYAGAALYVTRFMNTHVFHRC